MSFEFNLNPESFKTNIPKNLLRNIEAMREIKYNCLQQKYNLRKFQTNQMGYRSHMCESCS